jgi:ribonucleoside-diphosphate reductase alpha chain
VECASRRQKWIDMGQSLNLYIAAPNGRKLNDMYFHAWESGLKTTYYLRSVAATTKEKSSLQSRPSWVNQGKKKEFTPEQVQACSIEAMRNGGECEACQ